MSIKLSAVELAVPQNEIYYISWNIDACEGLGFLETNDAKNGKVTIYTPSSLLECTCSFIEGMKNENIDIKIDRIREV